MGGVFFGEPMEDPVILVGYDERWPRRFYELRSRLRTALGAVALRIDHIGSTSVPGLASKPVIDVQVSVPGIEDEDSYRSGIENLGWPLRYRSPERRFFRPPRGEPRSVHVHVVESGGEEERRKPLFVAYLRAHRERRDAYERLKRNLANSFGYSRLDYTDGKDVFIEETLLLAEEWVKEGGRRS